MQSLVGYFRQYTQWVQNTVSGTCPSLLQLLLVLDTSVVTMSTCALSLQLSGEVAPCKPISNIVDSMEIVACSFIIDSVVKVYMAAANLKHKPPSFNSPREPQGFGEVVETSGECSVTSGLSSVGAAAQGSFKGFYGKVSCSSGLLGSYLAQRSRSSLCHNPVDRHTGVRDSHHFSPLAPGCPGGESLCPPPVFQNTFWFGLGGCAILLIPSIIFSIKLAKYYRRMDTEDVFEE